MMEFAAGFGSQPRGLHNFISDIRNAKSKDDERMRVDKELANIRHKFSTPANMTSYDKKKYVWKLCYIYMLGYEIDFGHVEFISLLSSTKFQEKSVGYMAFSMMFRPGDELMTLAVNSMRNDIVGRVHFGQTLALGAVSNMGGTDLADALAGDVQRLVTPAMDSIPTYNMGPNSEQEYQNKNLICKKAALCLLRLFRTNPECIVPQDWVSKIAKLLEDRDLGVITSVMSLLLGFASTQPSVFEPLVPYVISILTRLVVNRTCSPDYLYYFTPSPWLQVKCLRFLQYFRIPSDKTQLELLNDVLNKILVKTETSESNNKSNADHSVLFEAINLIIIYGSDCPAHLKEHCSTLLGKFVAAKDPNTRYLGIDAMTRMAKLDGPEAADAYQTSVLESLKDVDVSLRKKALNLLYVMAFDSNAKTIVEELVMNLTLADASTKEDIVVKIAILAEKYNNNDWKWYIDTMMQVILVAGDYVAEAVWFRIVQVVTSNESIHHYAAEKMLRSVKCKFAHDTIVSVAAYLLGEIGFNISETEGMTGYDQFAALHQHFANASSKVQAILLTTYIKFVNLYPEQTKDVIVEIFQKHSTSGQLEIQQRSCEYSALANVSAATIETVLGAIPPLVLEDRVNVLIRLDNVESKNGGDRSAFSIEPAEKDKQSTPSVAIVMAAPDKAPKQQVVDLLDMGLETTVVETSSNVVTLSTDAQAKMKSFFNKACLARGFANPKPLMENDAIAVSVAHEYRAHQGRMNVSISNKGHYELTDLTCEVKSLEGLAFKVMGPSLVKVAVGGESKLQIASECTRPFSGSAVLDVSFKIGGSRHEYHIPIPTTVTSFSAPLSFDQPTFMARWAAITAENTQQQLVFSSAHQVSADLIKSIRSSMMPSLNIGAIEGMDNEKTFTGCCTFTTAPGPDGKAVAVGALLRLEGEPSQNKFRITVRATNPIVSSAIKDVIVNQLS